MLLGSEVELLVHVPTHVTPKFGVTVTAAQFDLHTKQKWSDLGAGRGQARPAQATTWPAWGGENDSWSKQIAC